MRGILLLFLYLLCFSNLPAQIFTRSELPTVLDIPWEMTYGPDGFLWITESQGRVSRVNPNTGAKTVVYTAADYADGSPLEKGIFCFHPNMGSGCLGLALHPDFLKSATSFVYFVYSYNSGSPSVPATRFKIAQLTWDATSQTITANKDLVTDLPTGYDHLGGRLIAIKQQGIPYLYFTTGDNGISEDSEPTCYIPQTSNPNNLAQDPNYKNGKIHRFNIDGTVPADNPIPGNSFYTRGHRNPQGLMYNAEKNILFNVEHGDRTDDEINLLEKGMNYGWKNVRGYHTDNNYPGEQNYIQNYVSNPFIANDELKPAFYAWCTAPQPASSNYLDWCTVAPSDGIYYNSTGIPAFTNSLLVVTLKNGSLVDQELYQFKLNEDGKSLTPSTDFEPNPQRFFGKDQLLNGRLRDIAFSPDGKKIFLINNGGFVPDKITVYTYAPNGILIYPNPTKDVLKIDCEKVIAEILVYDLLGQKVFSQTENTTQINVSNISKGVYFLKAKTTDNSVFTKRFVKE